MLPVLFPSSIPCFSSLPLFSTSILYLYSLPLFSTSILYLYSLPLFSTSILYLYSLPLFSISIPYLNYPPQQSTHITVLTSNCQVRFWLKISQKSHKQITVTSHKQDLKPLSFVTSDLWNTPTKCQHHDHNWNN